MTSVAAPSQPPQQPSQQPPPQPAQFSAQQVPARIQATPQAARPSRGDSDLADRLDVVVRGQVRAEGLDPQRDGQLVRRIVLGAVRDHDDRSLTGAVERVSDPAWLVEELVARVAGFGPLQRHLDDPEVEEIWINDPARVR